MEDYLSFLGMPPSLADRLFDSIVTGVCLATLILLYRISGWLGQGAWWGTGKLVVGSWRAVRWLTTPRPAPPPEPPSTLGAHILADLESQPLRVNATEVKTCMTTVQDCTADQNPAWKVTANNEDVTGELTERDKSLILDVTRQIRREHERQQTEVREKARKARLDQVVKAMANALHAGTPVDLCVTGRKVK